MTLTLTLGVVMRMGRTTRLGFRAMLASVAVEDTFNPTLVLSSMSQDRTDNE